MQLDADTFNSVFPVTGASVYENGTVVVTRKCLLQSKPHGKKAEIKTFSSSSLYRMLFLVKETRVRFLSMLTLTYPRAFANSGKECKKHLNKLLTWLRSKIAFNYVWFLEFQDRGAPHFHVLLDFSPSECLRTSLAASWAKYVCLGQGEEEFDKVFRVHSHKKQWEKIRDADGAAKYVAKYAAKARQKDPKRFQNTGRFWGASRGVKEAIPRPVEVQQGEDEIRGRLHSDGHPARSWDIIPKYVFARSGPASYKDDI